MRVIFGVLIVLVILMFIALAGAGTAVLSGCEAKSQIRDEQVPPGSCTPTECELGAGSETGRQAVEQDAEQRRGNQ